ncbi:hypothetical protein ODE01S_10400 [Oceanithermus desulfurans NBRC 100063]|uniref:Uncharacterized protein n=1 Tax=Oceanithermus desulfurans NBRC 100063 TaxID=1227550 RepID=A0A511RLD0_9DEIN|nr:hypothetical protein ODE01S_10400 [Oceanithermus desulfurans NBRC 100063]
MGEAVISLPLTGSPRATSRTPQDVQSRYHELRTTHHAPNTSRRYAVHFRRIPYATPLDSLRGRAYNRGKMRSFASIILRPALGLVLGRGGGGLLT